MEDSERLDRFKQRCHCENFYQMQQIDEQLRLKIHSLLNDENIDKFCMVDAHYYDFCEIPQEIVDKYNFYRDMYLIFGITKNGEMISKWVERWD